MANKSKVTKKVLKGIALRDSVNKTVQVLVESLKTDPMYQKRYRTGKKFLVHTNAEIKKGEKVSISQTRPISKRKSWQVVESK